MLLIHACIVTVADASSIDGLRVLLVRCCCAGCNVTSTASRDPRICNCHASFTHPRETTTHRGAWLVSWLVSPLQRARPAISAPSPD